MVLATVLATDLVPIEQAYCIARHFWREMRVAHRHLDRRVTKQILDRL
jgi:hypothetical protein